MYARTGAVPQTTKSFIDKEVNKFLYHSFLFWQILNWSKIVIF